MLICNGCGTTFYEDELYTFTERHPYGEGFAEEYGAESPCCHRGYSEARKCSICGEWVSEEDFVTADNMCKECFEEWMKSED